MMMMMMKMLITAKTTATLTKVIMLLLLFIGLIFKGFIPYFWGPQMVAQWLRHCATNREVAGSIPDGVTGIFH
jgi:threonine/homoserine/homoserine lactone efflux protein